MAAVLTRLENGSIRDTDLASTQLDFLRTHRDPAIRQRAVRRFGPAPALRSDTVPRFKPALRLKGAAPRGREIFLARCAACHQLGVEGHALGPDLNGLKCFGKEALLSVLLEPNREVRPDYVTYVVETRAGESLIGLLANENPTTITLKQPNGLQAVWPRANIQSIEAQPWSLMPQGWEAGLTPQNMADLLEYLLVTATL